MPCLTRKTNEKIFIDGGRIMITVIEPRGDKVRLGIDAPEDVAVDREEVHRRKLVEGPRHD